MKTSENRINDFTYAQIEPLKTASRIFRSFGKHILISFTFMVMLFLSTSYVSEEIATSDLRTEYYAPDMYRGLSSRLEQNSCKLFTCHSFLKTSHLVYDMYQKFGYKPVWTINHRLSSSATEVIQLLNNAAYYGLDKNHYHADELNRLYENLRKNPRADSMLMMRQDLELLLTDACLNFMIHLRSGIISTDSLYSSNLNKELADHLYKGIRHHDVTERILALQPDNLSYRNLQKALEKFLNSTILDDQRYEIPDPEYDHFKSYAAAKSVLARLGYLKDKAGENDTSVIHAIKEFQRYHGLTPNGILNKNTRKAMSLSNRDRYLRIALNLDRIRKSVDYKNECVFVNIPAYQLRVIKANKVQKSFNVVVGRPYTPTPELTSKIERITTVPEWNVPKSITLNEILPRVKKDSSYLIRNNFKVIDRQLNEVSPKNIGWKELTKENFDYYFVQNSGHSNALGLLKFSFNNPYRIYIHDTPSKRFFNSDIRAYSHGCIRLQHPDLFATYLVENNLHSEKKPDISKLVSRKIHKEIILSEPIEIQIRYLTCEADEDLNLYYYHDIYNRDGALINTLFN
ncbi:MAG: L,D-transpeptidase family protein [Bacteroidales bacterium]|nr:L,D-transpeptidase family protein [Bacteroidales bacterium]